MRYHFYHPSLECFAENPHDHRYYFTSEVLRGSLDNTVWMAWENPSLAPTDALPIPRFFTECNPHEEKNLENRGMVFAKPVTTFTTHAGSGYFISSDLLHQVKRVGAGPCVTRLVLGPKFKTHATVLQVKEEACSFSKPREESELWELIASTL